MQNMIFGNSIWHLITQSDVMTKFVLLLLLSMSIISWTIVFYKMILLNIKRRQMKDALDKIKKINTFEDVINLSSKITNTIPGYFLLKNLETLKFLFAGKDPKTVKLSEKQIELFKDSVYQSVEDIVQNEESYLPFLAISAAVSPLLGLFGTVWGLVHAFIRISEKRAADITVIAPGIAEALITTVAGLIVAIPALVMFHFISLQVKKLEHQLNILSDRMILVIQSVFLD
jgi:biopolymer transport protein TolQ